MIKLLVLANIILILMIGVLLVTNHPGVAIRVVNYTWLLLLFTSVLLRKAEK